MDTVLQNAEITIQALAPRLLMFDPRAMTTKLFEHRMPPICAARQFRAQLPPPRVYL